MLCLWVFDSGSWIGHHASILGTVPNCTGTGLQGSAQVLRLPSLELRQNALVHTVRVEIGVSSEHSMILFLTHILGALALLWLAFF